MKSSLILTLVCSAFSICQRSLSGFAVFFLCSFPVTFFFFQLLAAFFRWINYIFDIVSFRSKNVSWIY